MLKIDSLHPYDIWAPIVKSPPFIPYHQAVDWISEALSPLGREYVDILRRGCLEERWVDYAPSIGKNQGAASSLRVADKPPFIFMSYIDDILSVSTLSHELGHSLHLHFAYLNQPEIYNDYELFSSAIVETASNFNQAMTREYLRKSKKDDPNFQLSLIEEAISNFHRYFFIMPTLAQFEFEVFNRAQQDQPLNASILNGIMTELFSEGYGNTLIDDPERTAITWAQFPHLYDPFYTFQYSVGISAAHALEARVRSDEPDAADDYLEFLKAGTSLYPIQLWELAGVDMTTPEPVETAFTYLDNLIDELALLSN
jgi:oligoendopeptidase F